MVAGATKIVRFLANGKLDKSFGNGGVVTVSPPPGTVFVLAAAAVDSSGRTVLAGADASGAGQLDPGPGAELGDALSLQRRRQPRRRLWQRRHAGHRLRPAGAESRGREVSGGLDRDRRHHDRSSGPDPSSPAASSPNSEPARATSTRRGSSPGLPKTARSTRASASTWSKACPGSGRSSRGRAATWRSPQAGRPAPAKKGRAR